ncbi:MAG TPA: transcriptional regulator [Cyanobacteria bacterium UBA9971]|nr:transcriptional regulator [Cyanobacteria bacterium UBA9971]
MSKKQLKSFGRKIRELRLDKELTQQQFAEKINLSTNFVGMVERGERNTSLLKVFTMAKALEVKPKELFDFD